LGAGFGGLTFAQHFHYPNARVTVVDRTNHHLFQPLLYQVATAGLSAPEIAQPIRSILSHKPNTVVLMEDVLEIDLATKRVVLGRQTLCYDYLIIALGSVTGYFGHPEWEQFAPGLKTLDDALHIRRNILLSFEKAETEPDVAEQKRLMTIVVVGGGPTGVELAGAFSELARFVLRKDFDHIDPTQAHVILIEAGPRILAHMPPDLSESALEQLQKLHVDVRTSTKVKNIGQNKVELENGETIHTANIIWAAGVSASPLTRKLAGVELDRGGRIIVKPDLSVPGHPEVFAIGDLAFLVQENGQPVPGVSPAAMQMAKHVARIIEEEIPLARPHFENREPFRYWDKGTMATIGRSKAVAYSGPIKMHGFIAWLAWLFVHLIFLVGFRNKVFVVFQWIYSYFTYRRGARIITDLPPPVQPPDAKALTQPWGKP
ncbi:MAG: FAD-dependent pyridine nucleotide-disulfide oxidoreductase, partial [Verrucomicrobiales bacterium]|nr:FAD-dependent pyridine nucleotide-disulfide oxidoreductase [Verrucomicrobiales bacterium]